MSVKLVRLFPVCGLLSLGLSVGAETAGDICASTTPGVYWSTLRTKTREIALDWPAGATSAELTIQPLSQSSTASPIVIAAGTASYAWTPFAGDAPEGDEFYTLTLAYLNGEELVGNVQTAEVAVLRASFTAADLPLDRTARSWTVVRESVIVPYDAGWFTNALAGSVATLTRTNLATSATAVDALSGAGWFGWNFRRGGLGKRGSFGLALANGDLAETLSAELVVPMPGFLLLMR